MNVLAIKRNRWFLLGFALGLVMLFYGFQLSAWRSPQTAYYNAGLKAYQGGEFQKSVQLFDNSLAAYQAEQQGDWMHRFVYPKPDREMAAQTNFHKAKALLRLQQGKPAVLAFKQSLKLNSGSGYPAGTSKADIERMHEEAMIVKYDLELLFKNNPSLANGEGKGQGQQGQGQPGNQQVPGQDPGKMPGKGNRDDI